MREREKHVEREKVAIGLPRETIAVLMVVALVVGANNGGLSVSMKRLATCESEGGVAAVHGGGLSKKLARFLLYKNKAFSGFIEGG